TSHAPALPVVRDSKRLRHVARDPGRDSGAQPPQRLPGNVSGRGRGSFFYRPCTVHWARSRTQIAAKLKGGVAVRWYDGSWYFPGNTLFYEQGFMLLSWRFQGVSPAPRKGAIFDRRGTPCRSHQPRRGRDACLGWGAGAGFWDTLIVHAQ